MQLEHDPNPVISAIFLFKFAIKAKVGIFALSIYLCRYDEFGKESWPKTTVAFCLIECVFKPMVNMDDRHSTFSFFSIQLYFPSLETEWELWRTRRVSMYFSLE